MRLKTNIHSGMKILFPIALMLACMMMASPPAGAQGFSISYRDVEFMISPGETITASFQVTNQSGRHQVLRIYSGDWVRIPDDITTYEFSTASGEEPRSFTDWMTFSPDQMELEPDESRDVFFEIHFPDDTALEGSYWGVIFVEEVPVIEPEGDDAEDNAMHVGIRTIFRYAVKIYATVDGTEICEGSFTDLLINMVNGSFEIKAIFNNSGNIYYRPEVWLEIHNSAGALVYQQDHIQQTVLPESTREYVFEVTDADLTPGDYLVIVLADYGGPTIVAAQATMRLLSDEYGDSPGDIEE
jgi:hypothetical protein